MSAPTLTNLAEEGTAGMAGPLPAAPPRPTRKRNGELACGCRPYHLYGDEGFKVCAEGRRLYGRVVALLGEPWMEEAKAAGRAYSDHIGLHEDDEAGGGV